MIFIFLILLILLASPVGATTRYVDPFVGPGSCLSVYNPATRTCGGGSSNAYSTISTGIAALNTSGGDTLDIRGGTYNEGIAITDASAITGTSYAGGTTIQAHSGETVTLRPGSGVNNNSVVQVYGGMISRYVTIKGTNLNFIMDGSNLGQGGVVVAVNNFVRLDGVVVCCNQANLSGKKSGMGLGSIGDNVEFINGVVRDMGVGLAPPFDTTSYNPSGGFGFYGMYWSGTNGIIRNNLFLNIGSFGIHAYHYEPADNVDNLIIEGNTFENVGGYGYGEVPGAPNLGGPAEMPGQRITSAILASSGEGFVIRNNVIKGPSPSMTNGISLFRGGNDSQIYNNTVYGQSGIGFEILSNSIPTPSTVQIRNNIASTNGTNIYQEAASGIVYSKNLCSSLGGTTHCDSSLTESAATTFVSTSDYHLKAGSKAINAATIICPPTDVFGTQRPQESACDIGAAEFSASTPAPTISVTGIGSPGTFLNPGITATTTDSTVTLSGLAECGTFGVSVQWINNRGGPPGSASYAGGTGPQGWTASGIALTANVVNAITFTVNCTGGSSASVTIKVRANGANAIVVALPMNEGSGTMLGDISGTVPANDATITGAGATWVNPGKFGAAIRIGSSGSVSIPDADTLDLSTFTLSAYVMREVNDVDYRAILRKNWSVPSDTYWLYASQESATAGCGSGTAGYAVGGYQTTVSGVAACSASALPINTWNRITVTYDGLNMRFYLNGNPIGSPVPATDLLLENTGVLQIGGSQYGELFRGLIDEVVVTNFAIPATFGASDTNCATTLTAANISVLRLTNCGLGAPPPGQPANLTFGAGSTVIFGPGSTATIGVQTVIQSSFLDSNGNQIVDSNGNLIVPLVP